MKTFAIAQILCAATALSFGETLTFNNTSGDYKWNTADNWSSGALPSSNDSVSINVSMEGWTYGTPLELESNVTVDNFSISANRSNWVSDRDIVSGGYTIYANSATFNTVQWFGSTINSKLNVSGTLTLTGSGDSAATRIYANLIDIKSSAVLAHYSPSTLNDAGISANTLNLNAWDSTFKAVADNYTSYSQFGGITGTGRILASDNNTTAHGYIVLSGRGTYSYSGDMNYDRKYWTNAPTNKSLSLIKNGSGTQYLTKSTKDGDGLYYVHLSDTTVNAGKLSMAGKSDLITLNGGTLEVYNATATNAIICDNFKWTNGRLSLAMKSATEHTSLSIANALTKGGDDSSAYVLNLYFDFTPVAGEYENLISYTTTTFNNQDLIFHLFASDGSLITDFNASASFGTSGMNVILTAVPEPATVAALLGFFALAIAAFRRRK